MIDYKIQEVCVKVSLELYDKLTTKLESMQTTPQKIRLARFADAIVVMANEYNCVIGDVVFMPTLEDNQFSFVAVTNKKQLKSFLIES